MTGRFTIDTDAMAEVYGDESTVGFTWPRTAAPVGRETPGRLRFALHDDDGVLCAKGWLIDGECPLPATYGMEKVLGLDVEPVDVWEAALRYGMAIWGCTVVRDGRGRSVIG